MSASAPGPAAEPAVVSGTEVEHEIDVVLADFVMPNPGGLQLIEELRRRLS